MLKKNKDLFDDTTMSFGEHLEALRTHLWKAIIGLVIGTTIAFYFSKPIIVAIQQPVVNSLLFKFETEPRIKAQIEKELEKGKQDTRGLWQKFTDWWNKAPDADETSLSPDAPVPGMSLTIDLRAALKKLHEADPRQFPDIAESAPPIPFHISLQGTELGDLLTSLRREPFNPRTDGPDEAFMIYLKVSLIVGVVISSPWIFFQLWLFVAAGLYAHERKYVYTYLPISLGLFLGGTLFCFYLVIPQVLNFLFEFNIWLGMRPEIKIGDWITFALIVSLMFGISFQLPLVMLFLERISLFGVRVYREKRRHAILVIAILSMVLTPSDPVSMMMMMIPLCILYEIGILLCHYRPSQKTPFEGQAA
jgi:sec-independent protein translocase protein TatC